VVAIQLSRPDGRSQPDKQQPEFFALYLREAAKWLSVVDLKHRGAAIELSKHPLHMLDGVAMVKATLLGKTQKDKLESAPNTSNTTEAH